ncbi:MAG: hypothetical protein LBF67_09700 [Prevotellaceae bacterium]|nr:hypothetical protein [Prevotellaceae bacterium]
MAASAGQKHVYRHPFRLAAPSSATLRFPYGESSPPSRHPERSGARRSQSQPYVIDAARSGRASPKGAQQN